MEEILRWFLYPFPQFSLNFGYMSIANKDLIQIVNQLAGRDSSTTTFSSDVAGPALIFLCSGIPFFWFLVYLFEAQWFSAASW